MGEQVWFTYGDGVVRKHPEDESKPSYVIEVMKFPPEEETEVSAEVLAGRIQAFLNACEGLEVIKTVHSPEYVYFQCDRKVDMKPGPRVYRTSRPDLEFSGTSGSVHFLPGCEIYGNFGGTDFELLVGEAEVYAAAILAKCRAAREHAAAIDAAEKLARKEIELSQKGQT